MTHHPQHDRECQAIAAEAAALAAQLRRALEEQDFAQTGALDTAVFTLTQRVAQLSALPQAQRMALHQRLSQLHQAHGAVLDWLGHQRTGLQAQLGQLQQSRQGVRAYLENAAS